MDEKAPPKSFTFDGVYGVGSTTEQIYADVGFPLVESVMEGYNGTGMASTDQNLKEISFVEVVCKVLTIFWSI